MNSREKIKSILKRDNKSGTAGFWTGNPHWETVDIYLKQTGLKDREQIYKSFNDDCRWIMGDYAYHQPGRSMFYVEQKQSDKEYKQARAIFSDAENISDIEKYDWPQLQYLKPELLADEMSRYSDKTVFSGIWSPFFHIVSNLFGMEKYFINMYENPKIVHAATEKVVGFLLEANKKYFEILGDKFDVFFFGNDFGTQLDLFVAPDKFDEFIFPHIKKFISLAKKYNKTVMLHSCGSIYRIIPQLIEAGIDILHPIQAKAANMDIEHIVRYKRDLIFCGGVDTQDLLPFGKPQQIKDVVYKLRDTFDDNIIISPSHEALLKNVPYENVLAMSQAALEKR